LYHLAKAAPDYPAQAICFLLNMPLNRGMFSLTSQKYGQIHKQKLLHKALPSARKLKRKARWEESHEDS
jgi:hypothetical protein